MQIIANLGHNIPLNELSWDRAIALIEAAKECGVDGICVPVFKASSVYRDYKKYERYEIPLSWYPRLAKRAEELGLEFYVAPSSSDTVLSHHLIDGYHVENGNTKYVPLLEKIARTNKTVLLSTGFVEFPEVDEAIRLLCPDDDPDAEQCNVIVMHSTGQYPTAPENMQLTRILDLMEEFFPLYVGLESYSVETGLDYIAMAYNPQYIMRKFDLADKKGVEGSYSLDPSQMKALVNMRDFMKSVNEPQTFVEGSSLIETDILARKKMLRCEKDNWLLPPSE